MVCTFSKAPPVAYFRQTLDYYDTGVHDAQWYAPANHFGVTDGDAVDFDLLARLYAGVGPDGAGLLSNRGGRIIDRQSGYDLTYSAPKSFSLRYAMASDEERQVLIKALFEAVRTSTDALQRVAGWARRGKAGAMLEAISFTAALFLHNDSRPSIHADGSEFGDPNVHVHCIILNIAMRSDGTVGAIQSVLLRSAKMFVGAVFHAALAANLARLRLSSDRVGKNGIFEIGGIGDWAIKFFSGRREELERSLEARGATSAQNPQLASKIAAFSRKKKQKTSLRERLATWRAAALRNNIDFERERRAVEAAFRPITEEEGEALYQQRLIALTEGLTTNEAVLDHREILRTLNAALVGTGLSPVRASQALAELMADGHLVRVGSDQLGFPLFSTTDMIKAELAVVWLAEELGLSNTFELAADKVTAACRQHGLSEEQTRAALAVTRRGRAKVIEGAPGTGKTTALRPIVASYKAAGYRVIGAATAWKIARSLSDDLEIEARATQDWLTMLQHGKPVLDSKSVLVVDEAGLIGARDMRTLLEAVKAAGAKIILAGDRNQIQPIAAGPGLGLVCCSVDVSRIETIVRQREGWLRQVVIDIGKGEALKALKELLRRGNVRFETGLPEAVAALVAQWRHLTDAGGAPLLVARTNQQLRMISESVRRDRRAHGELSDAEVTFTGRLPNGDAAPVSLSEGDRVRFLAKNKQLDVINGTVGEVVKLVPGPTSLETQLTVLVGNRHISFSLSELADADHQVLLGWDYGWSGFGSQGTTVDDALILADANFDRHLAYVTASRARNKTVLFVDSSSIDSIEADLAEHGALDQEAERLIKLSKRMARKRHKLSTLDFIPPAVWDRWRTAPDAAPAPMKDLALISPVDWQHLTKVAEIASPALCLEGPDYV